MISSIINFVNKLRHELLNDFVLENLVGRHLKLVELQASVQY